MLFLTYSYSVVVFFLLLGWNIFPLFVDGKGPPNLLSSQLNALHTFYNATNGANWSWKNESQTIPWNFDQVNPNPCAQNWQGITCACGTVSCNLTDLILSRYNITGQLPDSIGSWKTLQSIDLSHNSISGTIPKTISYWTQLLNLDFAWNLLTNAIPSSIGSLCSLQTLTLSRNYLNYLPNEICNLTNLQTLQVDGNEFHQKFPNNLNNLKSLRELIIEFNRFSGSLPVSLVNCPSITVLEMSENLFNGSLPFEYGELRNLTHFSVDRNALTGTIPSSLGNLINLRTFSIEQNQIFGSFPTSFANLTKLRELFCAYNLLTGPIPANFSNMKELFFMDIGPNALTGEVTFLKGMKNLSIVYCSNNFFSGNFTFLSIIDFTHMVDFTMFDNHFTGYLPFSMNNNASLVDEIPFFVNKTKVIYINSTIYSSLVYYSVEGNYFTGNISTDFHYFRDLRYFSASNNYLTGPIPTYLPNLKFLETMNLSLNALTGTIPPVNITLGDSKLYQYLVYNNYLTGTLREDLSSFTNLIAFSFHHNYFHGTIPLSFGKLFFLEQFFVQNNDLTGSLNGLLNDTFSSLYFLRNLDLSNNRFTGYLDDSFFARSKNLETFAAVSNCLTGTIPETICTLQELTALALDGLSTASSCRNNFFLKDNMFGFNGFLLKDHLTGQIHECLFHLPSLQSLHLSGNSFTGTLPNDLNISSSLTDLSLSHNILSGSIPSVIQQRLWSNLDLSYNQFTGTLSSNFAPYESGNNYLKLQVNRLSGNVPSQILSAQEINILQGNIFTCETQNKNEELPSKDPNLHSYSCGSNVVNNILFTWLGLAVVLLFIFGYRKFGGSFAFFLDHEKKRTRSRSTSSSTSRDSGSSYFHSLRMARQSFTASFALFIENHPDSNVTLLFTLFKQMGRVLSLLTVYSLLILLPVFVSLKRYYKTYHEQYAWIVSGIFLSGSIPAIVIFFFLSVFICFLFYLFTRLIFVEIQHHRERINSIRQDSLRIQQLILPQLELEKQRQQQQQVKRRRKSKRKSQTTTQINMFVNTFIGWKLKYFAYFLVLLFNLITFGGVDFIYVLISLNYNAIVVTFTSIFVAFFRVVTNNLVYRKMMPNTTKALIYAVYQFLRMITPDKENNDHNHDNEYDNNNSNNNNNINDESQSVDQQQEQQSYSQEELIDLFEDLLETKQFWSLPYHFANDDIIFLSFLILLNTVVFPVLAIFIILPDCYYNVFYAAETVTSSYSYINCVFYLVNGLIEAFCVPTSQSTSYLPPFIYSYQCSSKILINYIPVYITTFILVGFIIPMKDILFKYWHNQLWFQLQVEQEEQQEQKQYQDPEDRETDFKEEVEMSTKPSIPSPAPVPVDIIDEEKVPKDEKKKKTTTAPATVDTPKILRLKWYLHQLEQFMSMRLLFPNISPEKEMVLQNTIIHKTPIFFDKVKFSIQISSLLAIIIIYGALFPPLALIGGLSIYVIISYEELMIGKLLFYSLQKKKKQQYSWIYSQLEKEIQNIHQCLYASIRILLYLPAFSFAFILFDIWGSEGGWQTALPISFSFICIPLILNLGYSLSFNQHGQRRDCLSQAKLISWWNWCLGIKERKDDVEKENQTEMVVVQNPLPGLKKDHNDKDNRKNEEEADSDSIVQENNISRSSRNNPDRPLPSLPPQSPC